MSDKKQFDRPAFNKDVEAYKKENPLQRHGQAVFNVMHNLHLEAANLYRSSKWDPFFNNNLSEMFIEKCRLFIKGQGVTP